MRREAAKGLGSLYTVIQRFVADAAKRLPKDFSQVRLIADPWGGAIEAVYTPEFRRGTAQSAEVTVSVQAVSANFITNDVEFKIEAMAWGQTGKGKRVEKWTVKMSQAPSDLSSFIDVTTSAAVTQVV